MSRRALRLHVALLLVAAVAYGQEPETRAETLRRAREEKAAQLQAPEPSRLERVLLDLENGRLFERLLSPPQGLYPKFGSVTPGSGLSLGPGYRHVGIFGGHADVSASAVGSLKKYWMVEGRLMMPRLAAERASIDLHAQRYDFPSEDFFGIGPDSRRSDHVIYGLRNTVVGVSGTYRPSPALSVGAGIDYLSPAVGGMPDTDRPILSRFDDSTAPGVAFQPDFVRYDSFVEFNHREPRGNPRRGGRYALRYQHFEDRENGRYSFDRVEADVQRYIPLLRDRRVLALRGFASVSDADEGAEVPFYLQRTLGGPDDLRGFRRFRFRDRNMLLLQAEYRWEIFTAVDGAIFYDAGKVASRIEDLDLRNLESDYGIGFRFGTRTGVFLRIEGAFGSSGGKHFVFRTGHVF